ncbi:glycosyltransferase family 39 protein [Nocardia jiangxiensis]|uniref:Glycosyltransferase family 39 protein n=2 Tax=Nocardia jiangxiensis TaxID=282685 RepID=A0ABW6S3D5_9NOCA|nr:glycosyltransferase family 39 protein [Nocardia jiangxiensis]
MVSMSGVDEGAGSVSEKYVGTSGTRFRRDPGNTRPRWVRPSLAGLLIATAVLYLWGLSSAGWTNPFYAASVQAGTQDWKALLFASLDPGNGITVDKPPAAMWVMALSGRLFGFTAWSMLMPEALIGVATVALLYGAVRRCAGYAAGLIAGAGLALTPVAALMFRYDNPDALMMLLVVAAAYCVVRALRSPGTRWWSASTGWLALAGVAVGFGFLAKMMQAFLVLPGLALVVLVALPGGFWSRIGKLVTAGSAVLISAGWYVALVQVWPANARPYIGGSTDNSLWDLAVGYNGLGRVLGNKNKHQAASAHAAVTGPDGATAGAHAVATNAPTVAAQGATAATHGTATAAHGASAATHGTDAAVHAQAPHFGGMAHGETGLLRLFQDSLATEFAWLVPAAVIGVLAGLWLTRRAPRIDPARAALILWGGWLVGTWLVLSYMSSSFHTYYTIELTPALAALGAIGGTLLWERRAHVAARVGLGAMSAATGLWVFHLLDETPTWLPSLRWTLVIAGFAMAALLILGISRLRRFGVVVAAVAVIAGLAGPAAYAVETVALPHSGGSPYSGPVRVRGNGFGHDSATRSAPRLDAMLSDAENRWAAAAVGSQQVGAIELRTGASLLAVGGFSGRDDSPTLAQFEQYVADGDVHYFLMNASPQSHGTGRVTTSDEAGAHTTSAHRDTTTTTPPGSAESSTTPQPGRSSAASNPSTSGGRISAWVQAHYTAVTVDGVQVYDLTVPPRN